MSDKPYDPKARPRRTDSRREPATIDLSATETRAEPATDAPLSEPASSEPQADDVSAVGAAEGSSHDAVRPTPDEVIPDNGSFGSDAGSAERATSLPPHRAPEAPRRGPGLGALLGAGLVGGLLGAGATALTETWWRPRAAGTETRLAQVEQRVAAAPNLAPLEARVSALTAETKTLADQFSGTRALAERSAKQAQEALERPQPGPSENAASAAALADIATRLDGVEKQVEARAQALAAVEKQSEARAQALAAVEKQSEARAQALAALEKDVAARAQAVSTLQGRVGSVEERAQAAASAAQALEKRIADQDGRLAALAKQVSERGSDTTTATLRVTLADRLQDSLREGAPVGQTIAVLRRLEVKPDSLAPLEPYAKNAPPSAAALAQEFEPIGERMIAEARTPASDWGERVWRMLDKVVTIRAVDDPKATDVAGLVGRIEGALDRGAVGEAAKAWEALPEPARRAAPEFGARLQQRAAAEAAAQTIYAEGLSALEASTR